MLSLKKTDLLISKIEEINLLIFKIRRKNDFFITANKIRYYLEIKIFFNNY